MTKLLLCPYKFKRTLPNSTSEPIGHHFKISAMNISKTPGWIDILKWISGVHWYKWRNKGTVKTVGTTTLCCNKGLTSQACYWILVYHDFVSLTIGNPKQPCTKAIPYNHWLQWGRHEDLSTRKSDNLPRPLPKLKSITVLLYDFSTKNEIVLLSLLLLISCSTFNLRAF